MTVSIMRISEMYDKDVFTDAGYFFGKISDVVLGKFMIHGWVIKATPSSMLRESMGSVRAVIVPHKAVRSIGDIVLISHNIELTRESQGDDVSQAQMGAGEAEATMAPQQQQQQAPQYGTPQQPPQRAPFRF